MNRQDLDTSKLRAYIRNFQFRELFVESLGWDNPSRQSSEELQFNGKAVPYSFIAEKSNVPVLQFEQNQFKDQFDKKKFHQELKKRHTKHIVLFSNKKSSFFISYLSKEGYVRDHHIYFKGQNGDDFISKLANIHFGIDDAPQIAEIGARLEKAFNTEKITKKFFEDFKTNHLNFKSYILGIKEEEEKKWYASLILNRLMFIWFIQKKGFVNNDRDYLQTKLDESKKRASNKYYSEFLSLLFFEGFAKKPKERSERAKNLLGDIKYLNGGLFIPHSIEEKYKGGIKIPDIAFEKTFEVFGKYDWQVQESRGGQNEISPDVVGYIFEKYINELQQKSLGAYYTRDEITKYLSKNTIQNCILDKLNQKGYQFENVTELLNKPSANLCKLILTNEDSILNTLTILDPAVGSGAFLVSAMKELIDIYSPIIDEIKTLGDRELKSWYKSFKTKHKSNPYGIKKEIILKNLYGVDIMKEATEVCKLRLFLSLVSSALNEDELEPLPNMDFNIMHGNSLIGFLKEENHIKKNEEQLKWSEVLGSSYQEIKEKYNKLVSQYKNKPLSFEKLREQKKKIHKFLDENNFKLNRLLADKCNKEGLKYSPIIDIQDKKKIFGKKRAVLPEDFSDKANSNSLNPFHWNFAFNSIMNKGGFDIILTNPPWDKINLDEKEFFTKHDSSIEKKKTKTSEMLKIKTALLNKSNIRENYYNNINSYSFQRHYFLKFYQCEINNKTSDNKKSSAHMDNYRLFTERCFDILSNEGYLGIVLPSGLHKDDGAVGLRKELLFKKVKIEGLIDFQNQMSHGKGKIFEGVDSRFKFLLLNLKKDDPQDEFPCQFHGRDLKVLDDFPKNSLMKQSIKEIKKLSPRDCSIIEFRNLKDKEIFKKAVKFPRVGEILKNSWNPNIYTEELNETRSSYLFSNCKIADYFLSVCKGDNIYQYDNKFSKPNRYLDKNNKVISNSLKPCLKNKYYKNYRLVIRTIASNTNERSLISAIIPKNHFISNSLHGVHIEQGSALKALNQKTGKNNLKLKNVDLQNNKYMLLFQAFLNSFVVDYFIRQKVSSNINKKYITPLHIPRLTEKDLYFKELVERSAKLTCIGKEFDDLADEIGIQKGCVVNQEERWKIQAEIDAIVAYIYDLTKNEFKYVLDTFKTGKNKKRLNALKKYALEAFKKDKFLKKSA